MQSLAWPSLCSLRLHPCSLEKVLFRYTHISKSPKILYICNVNSTFFKKSIISQKLSFNYFFKTCECWPKSKVSIKSKKLWDNNKPKLLAVEYGEFVNLKVLASDIRLDTESELLQGRYGWIENIFCKRPGFLRIP